MKLISTRAHGVLDYIMGISLIASPSLLEFNLHGIESTIFYILGVVVLFYSLLTNYELGPVKLIPMKAHITLDVLSGLFLAASPWLFNFSDVVHNPHLVLGLVVVCTALVTSTTPMKEIN